MEEDSDARGDQGPSTSSLSAPLPLEKTEECTNSTEDGDASGRRSLSTTPLEPPPCGLPVELWSRIFSHLTDVDLLRRVIPVCRLFRTVAFRVGFRYYRTRPSTTPDLEEEEEEDLVCPERKYAGRHLGCPWGMYEFSREFLEAIPTQKEVVVACDEHYLLTDERASELENCLNDLLKIHSGVETLALINLHASLRTSLVETLPTYSDLTKLRIVFAANCGGLGWSVGWDEESRRLRETFDGAILSIADRLRELRMDFIPSNSERMLTGLDRTSSLTHLTMRYVGQFEFTPSAALRSLVVLDLKGFGDWEETRVAVNIRWLLKNYPHLEELRLRDSYVVVDDEGDELRFQAPKLKKLYFDGRLSTQVDYICDESESDRDDYRRKRPSFLEHFPGLTHLGTRLSTLPLVTPSDHRLHAFFANLEELDLFAEASTNASGYGEDPVDDDDPGLLEALKRALISCKSLSKFKISGVAKPYQWLPLTVNLKYYSSPSRFESVPSHWVNLAVIRLGRVLADCLREICIKCPGIEDVGAELADLAELNQFLFFLRPIPTAPVPIIEDLLFWEPESHRKSPILLQHLALTIKIERDEDEDEDEDESVCGGFGKLFRMCNRALSQDDERVFLRRCPKMREFHFRYRSFIGISNDRAITMGYGIVRTCLGEVRRFLRTDYAEASMPTVDVSERNVRENTLPQEVTAGGDADWFYDGYDNRDSSGEEW